jgi:hypothetical protein
MYAMYVKNNLEHLPVIAENCPARHALKILKAIGIHMVCCNDNR